MSTLSSDEESFLHAWAACASNPHCASDRKTSPQGSGGRGPRPARSGQGLAWSDNEHARFLEAMERFPSGPWQRISDYIGTRTARQARTHAQKHKEKLERRHRKLQRMQSYLTPQASQARQAASTGPSSNNNNSSSSSRRHGIPWTPAEHNRLVEALNLYPSGPWRSVTAYVGTRTPRQVMAYGQKVRQQLATSPRGTDSAASSPSSNHHNFQMMMQISWNDDVLMSSLDELLSGEDLSDTMSNEDACPATPLVLGAAVGFSDDSSYLDRLLFTCDGDAEELLVV